MKAWLRLALSIPLLPFLRRMVDQLFRTFFPPVEGMSSIAVKFPFSLETVKFANIKIAFLPTTSAFQQGILFITKDAPQVSRSGGAFAWVVLLT